MRPALTGTKPAFVGSMTQSASVFPIPKTVKIKESRDLQSYSYIESESIEHMLMITHASKMNCENPSSFQRAQQVHPRLIGYLRIGQAGRLTLVLHIRCYRNGIARYRAMVTVMFKEFFSAHEMGHN